MPKALFVIGWQPGISIPRVFRIFVCYDTETSDLGPDAGPVDHTFGEGTDAAAPAGAGRGPGERRHLRRLFPAADGRAPADAGGEEHPRAGIRDPEEARVRIRGLQPGLHRRAAGPEPGAGPAAGRRLPPGGDGFRPGAGIRPGGLPFRCAGHPVRIPAGSDSAGAGVLVFRGFQLPVRRTRRLFVQQRPVLAEKGHVPRVHASVPGGRDL